MAQINSNEEQVTSLWQDFEHAKSYQENLSLHSQIPINVDFYEGRQWPAKTTETKDIPRPVVNIVKFITRNKKASIVGAPVSIVFTSNRNPSLAQKLTEFNKTIENEMEMDDIRNKKVQEGIVKGTSVVHYYWDSEARGELGDFEGGVRAEIIDPLNTFFANPQEQDEQKQKWIMIASRVEISAAKEMMSDEYKANKELVLPDDADSHYTDEVEQDGSKLCTVLTRYYRQDGEVYYERAVKSTMLHDGIPMTPVTSQIDDENREKLNDNYSDDKMDDGEDKLQDLPKEHDGKSEKKFSLYPISVYNYEPREKSIYGIGEVEGIIPNQKALNFIFSMQLLSIQNLAMGKWIVKKGALKQRINNAPGQIITDYTPYGVKGISRSDEPPISNAPMQFSEMLIANTRVVTGSTEVMTGEAQSSGQSGQAIANLQAQALKPIQELRERFLRSCKKEAKIIKQFYELFYEGKKFEYKNKDDQFVEEEFSGVEMNDTIFDISIEAGAGTPYSETLVISLLTEYLQAGYIDYETYLELLPAQVASFKATLLKKVKEGTTAQLKQTQEQLTALQEQVQQYQAYIEQLAKQLQAQGKTVDSVERVVNENRRLNATLAELQNEYTSKINQANAIMAEQNAQNNQMRNDAEMMALMMADSELNGQK
ncbi:MAG: hypothetical protein IJD77_00940 [Clostridia bacterium]|nr:hypothetical protein [Clostridia bacterium]